MSQNKQINKQTKQPAHPTESEFNLYSGLGTFAYK